MNFGDPSTFGTEMADRFVASGANLPPPVSDRVRENFRGIELSHSSTGLGSTNDLSWKSKN